MKLRLLEADGFDDDMFEDDIEDEEIIDYGEETLVNELKGRKISFPLLFEATYDDSGEAASISRQDKENIAQQYADAVIQAVEENKKFILSTLDIYDMEFYYDKIDANSFVTFIVTVDSQVPSDLLLNVIKRYLNIQIDDIQIDQDGENITVMCSAVLDNKYIKII